MTDDLMKRLEEAIHELVEAEVEQAFHDYECGCHDTRALVDALLAEVRKRLDELERRRAFFEQLTAAVLPLEPAAKPPVIPLLSPAEEERLRCCKWCGR